MPRLPAASSRAWRRAWYYLWRERRLPNNVDPLESRLDDPLERRRLAQIFEQGLDKIVGYALPLCRVGEGAPRWVSLRCPLRSEHMFLVPGDSPMGYRLPLDSLPWEPKGKRHTVHELDPFAPRPP